MTTVAFSPRFGLALALTSVVTLLGAHWAPDDRWWGVDIGATSASLYFTCIWVGVWLVSQFPHRFFPTEWSVAERRAWAGLFFGFLILLSFIHFMWALSRHAEVPQTLGSMASRHFIYNLSALLFGWLMVWKFVAGREAGAVHLDERDLRNRHDADRAGNVVLTAIVVVCIALLAALPRELLSWWLAPLVAANLLIGILIVKSLTEEGYLLLCYARGRS